MRKFISLYITVGATRNSTAQFLSAHTYASSTKSMASLEEVVQSLQFENNQLRTELKAQQTVNLKLRKEKADVSLALQDSKEEKR